MCMEGGAFSGREAACLRVDYHGYVAGGNIMLLAIVALTGIND